MCIASGPERNKDTHTPFKASQMKDVKALKKQFMRLIRNTVLYLVEILTFRSNEPQLNICTFDWNTVSPVRNLASNVVELMNIYLYRLAVFWKNSLWASGATTTRSPPDAYCCEGKFWFSEKSRKFLDGS